MGAASTEKTTLHRRRGRGGERGENRAEVTRSYTSDHGHHIIYSDNNHHQTFF